MVRGAEDAKQQILLTQLFALTTTGRSNRSVVSPNVLRQSCLDSHNYKKLNHSLFFMPSRFCYSTEDRPSECLQQGRDVEQGPGQHNHTAYLHAPQTCPSHTFNFSIIKTERVFTALGYFHPRWFPNNNLYSFNTVPITVIFCGPSYVKRLEVYFLPYHIDTSEC